MRRSGAAAVPRTRSKVGGASLRALVLLVVPLQGCDRLDRRREHDPAAMGSQAATHGGPATDSPALATLAPGPGHAEDATAAGSLGPRLARLWAATTKAWVVVVDGGRIYDPLADYLEAEGLPVFRTSDRALRALGAYAAHRLHA